MMRGVFTCRVMMMLLVTGGGVGDVGLEGKVGEKMARGSQSHVPEH
jgi:hypothetical protein